MEKGNNLSSYHDQTQVTQAQQSIKHLQNAINQAQSNPNQEVIQNIENALERAERSLSQAAHTTDNQGAIDLAQRELEYQKQAFQQLKS
ncbi:hypothetical protein [Aquibacillus sediminis]|uniref:hypothetical protein n=1 Tax=Aquibacillus sediminis TaxID=2574734 RepID=UPI0011094B62|nr:hypothetical protein [Aquibacillus sediminis]